MDTAAPREALGIPPAAATRRLFWGVLGGALAAVAGSALAFLRPHPQVEADAGAAVSYRVGGVRHVPAMPAGLDSVQRRLAEAGGRAARSGFFVVRREEGFVAFSDRCTHLGATLRYDASYPGPGCVLIERGIMCTTNLADPRVQTGKRGAFYCPAHGASFRLEDSAPLAGPAPRPLNVLPVRVAHGRVVVNTDPSAERRREGDDAPFVQIYDVSLGGAGKPRVTPTPG